MSDDDNITHDGLARSWLMTSSRHRLIALVGGSIVLALLLVVVAMALYRNGGAAQLDLSRPGYEDVQTQVKKTQKFKDFASTGTIDAETLEKFKMLYDGQVKQVTTIDAFDPAVLDTRTLGLELDDVPAPQPAQ